MKKIIISLSFLFIAQLAHTQKTETRTFNDIKKLSIFGKTYVAELIKADTNKIVITSQDLTMDKILTTESNGELKITVKGITTGNVSCKIYCKTLPSVIDINNGALIKSTENLTIDNIELITNTDGYLHLMLISKNIKASSFTGGDMTLEGTTQNLIASSNSNGTVRVEMMTIDSANVKAIGGAEIHLWAKNSIVCSTATNGKVHIYKPYPANIKETNESGGVLIKE